MRPKIRGWKEGVMSEDLVGFGHTHKKGDTVRYKKHRTIDEDTSYSKYEYHYIDLNNFNLIRTSKFLIEE